MIRRGIKVGIYSLLAIGVFAILWFVIKPLFGKGKTDSVVEVQAETQTQDPDAASRKTIAADGGDVGWNINETGWWYMNDDNTYYVSGYATIDGQKYYFNENGYMATGWTDIDGEGHYFSASGIEDPNAKQKMVALTYDDGPGDRTPELLECLKANNAKATFFVVGEQIESRQDTIKQEYEYGMEIGSHTYTHPTLTHLSSEEIVSEMNKNDELVKSLTGFTMEIMRPTGGGVNDTVSASVGKPMVNWDVDTLDWKTKDPANTVQVALEQVKDGSVILMHDLWPETVDASLELIPKLIEQGYKLVTVSELAKARGVALEKGVVYYDFYPQTTEGDTASEGDGGDTADASGA